MPPSLSLPSEEDLATKRDVHLLVKGSPKAVELEDTRGAFPPHDTIRQFGILVPSTLRRAQSSFRKAVEDEVTALAQLEREMLAIEDMVRAARRAQSSFGS